MPHLGRRIAAPSRRRSTCCRRCGSGTPGRGDATTDPPPRPAQARLAEGAVDRARRASDLGRADARCGGRAGAAVHRERDERARLFGGCHRTRTSRTASTTSSCTAGSDAVNPAREGTKASARYQAVLQPGETFVVRLRLSDVRAGSGRRHRTSTAVFRARQAEADEFYAAVIPAALNADQRLVMRQAIRRPDVVEAVLSLRRARLARGRPGGAAAARDRLTGRNVGWPQLYNADVISMPDKWEYPWYAAWDLAFHCVPIAIVDPDFAKEQLVLLVREWYMHPNGQLPAYEWALGDVNPPVHAWAAWRVYKIDKKRRGAGDRLVSRARVPEAAAELHVVGQPQGRHRRQRVRGRLPGARQHRRLRSEQAAADGRAHRAVRRHQLDGDVHAQHAGHRDGAGARERRLRGHREQVLGALHLHRAGDDDARVRRHRPVG